MMLVRPSLLYSASLLVVAGCSGATGGSQPAPGLNSTGSGGSGNFWISVHQPTAGSAVGASYYVQASFVAAGSAPTCETSTMGACTVDPCYAPTSDTGTSPDVGEVIFTGSAKTAVSVEPQSDGSYLTETLVGQLPWTSGGQTVTLQWAHAPGTSADAGNTVSLTTPVYIALTPGSPFADVTPTLDRTGDLTLSWTTDTAPSPIDEVSASLTSGSVEVTCLFGAAEGTGTMPAAALQKLAPGTANFNIHSGQHPNERIAGAGGGSWSVSFNLDAYARTSYGVGTGSVTIQ